MKKQQKETRDCIKKMYIDKTKNEITAELFSELMDEFTSDEAEQAVILGRLEEKKLILEDNITNGEDNSAVIKKHLECEGLCLELVRFFIDKIVVHKDTGGSRRFTLEIFWSF